MTNVVLNRAYNNNILEQTKLQQVEKINREDYSRNSIDNILKNQEKIEIDRFEPSLQYINATASKEVLKDGFSDIESFISMAETLKKRSILSSQDVSTARILAQNSEGLQFSEFDKMIRDTNLNIQLRGLINQLVQKLKMVNFVSKANLA